MRSPFVNAAAPRSAPADVTAIATVRGQRGRPVRSSVLPVCGRRHRPASSLLADRWAGSAVQPLGRGGEEGESGGGCGGGGMHNRPHAIRQDQTTCCRALARSPAPRRACGAVTRGCSCHVSSRAKRRTRGRPPADAPSTQVGTAEHAPSAACRRCPDPAVPPRAATSLSPGASVALCPRDPRPPVRSLLCFSSWFNSFHSASDSQSADRRQAPHAHPDSGRRDAQSPPPSAAACTPHTALGGGKALISDPRTPAFTLCSGEAHVPRCDSPRQ